MRQENDQEEAYDFIDHYQLEKIIFQQLPSANPMILNKLINELAKISHTPMCRDKLKEKKYRLVALITLLTRSAISFGCSPNASYRLSDQLIGRIDSLQSVEEIKSFIPSLIDEYQFLLKKRTKFNSIPVNKACEYIYSNLYNRISLEKISHELTIHPTYLSTTFKKTTGLSLRKFIISARVEEAKYLLTHTEMTFNEISNRLHFCNQSYFCKVFKQVTSYTPKEYRVLF